MLRSTVLSGLLLFAGVAQAKEVCVVTLELSQTHYTLDIWEHLKDAANAVEFDIPVDCDYYNTLRVGEELEDSFRMGSLLIRGSFGDWNVEVVKKKKVTVED
jgi:hypothetical protein